MPTPQELSDQVLALPGGPGGVSGLGETFAADPYTGTGRFRVPIPLPAGYNGLKPDLALVYSSGAGSGLCGFGWSFGVGAIRRRTDKGIPGWTEDDRFLFGDDELVPKGGGYFVRRSEGAFARIRHIHSGGEDFWAVTDRSGTRFLFGRDPAARDGDGRRIVAWHLTEARDADNNTVTYSYTRDADNSVSYLSQIDWAGAYRVVLDYETRPDPIRSGRAGFAQTTVQRLTQIRVQVRRTSTSELATFDTFALGYDASPTTGLSRLRTLTRTGTASDDTTATWPALQLAYTEPDIGGSPVTVSCHPPVGLSDPNTSLVDMDGDGLADILQSQSNGWVVWRNHGDGSFARPVSISGPAGVQLADDGVFLSDLAGEGWADLVTPQGFYPNAGAGLERFRPFPAVCSLDLEDPDARFLDLNGDGVGDVLAAVGDALYTCEIVPGVGYGAVRRHAWPFRRFPRPSDPWTRIADVDGDGLADVVRVSRGGLEIWQNLGHGSFGAPRRLALPENLPVSVQPEHILLLDVTGTGAADVVVLRPREIWIFANGCGASLAARQTIRCRSIGADGAVDAVDLYGTGVRGLLLADLGAWTFYPLWGGTKPDLLAGVDNGVGLSTSISYGSAIQHAIRDRAAGKPWPDPLPYPVMVVNGVQITDATTGMTVSQRLAYHDGYHDAAEREFRGFARVETWDAEETADLIDTSRPSRRVSFFDIGNGRRPVRDYFPVPSALPQDSVPNHDGARRALRGLLVREEIYGEDSSAEARLPYQVIHHGYTVARVVGPPKSGTPSFFAAQTSSLTAHTERTADPRIVIVTRTFDPYGRMTEERTRAQGRRGTFETAWETQQTVALERYTATSYLTRDLTETDDYDADYTPTYRVDRPSSVDRYGMVESSPVLLSRDRSFYDGDDYVGLGYPGSDTDADLTRGRLSCHITRAFTTDSFAAIYDSGWGASDAATDRGNFLTDADEIYLHAERNQYDSHGMRVGVKNPNGHETTIAYDETYGLFVVGLTDAAGNPATLSRGDFPFEVTALEDPNGNRTEFTWDPRGLPLSRSVMGKEISSVWQGDPNTDPTESYDYDLTTIPVRITVQRRQMRLGATLDTTRYLDGLGRLIQERITAEPDPDPRWRVSGWQIFNQKGLVVRAYQPAFGDSADYAAGSTETASISTTYDPLGRPLRVDHPDGTYETTSYHPWVQDVYDRNDNASAIEDTDARYGDYLDRFADHLNTPTRTYADALGRAVAVREDTGSEQHTTRTVYDLLDRGVEVWDARDLETATWLFAYDDAGRRVRSEHTTALGVRVLLQDAANNPIWSRDAREIEVDRTFDTLNRPLTEHTGEKLRRMWSYLDYDAEDPDLEAHQANNLFGRLEEERDADGLRTLTYDWRGLVLTTTSRFWRQKDGSDREWNNTDHEMWTGDWDPAVDDTARDSISEWLEMPDLGDSAEIATTYDAAGRPTVVDYPGALQVQLDYDEGGRPLALRLSRDSGSTSQDIVTGATYNARGQFTGLTYGSGLETQREYDADLERLTRIFTHGIVDSETVYFQDLDYAYDPVGNPVAITDNLTDSTYKANQIIPNSRGFWYDGRYRLVRATGKKHASISDKTTGVVISSPDPGDYDPYDYDYVYDAVGNLTHNDEYRTGGDLSYKEGRIDLFNGDEDEAGSFTAADEGNFTYDENGNTLHTPRINALGYTHDNQPRYVDLGTSGQIRYLRHGDQRVIRLAKKPGVFEMNVYLGPWEYHLRDKSGGWSKLVLHLEMQGRHAQAEVALDGTDPDAVELFYHHSDHLGSGHVLTGEDGELLSQEEYFPYGRSSDRRDGRNRYRFIGVEMDADTGLCMTGPRTYDPVSARFLQGDPLADQSSQRVPYHYGSAAPITRLDIGGNSDAPADLSPQALQGRFNQGAMGAALSLLYRGNQPNDHTIWFAQTIGGVSLPDRFWQTKNGRGFTPIGGASGALNEALAGPSTLDCTMASNIEVLAGLRWAMGDDRFSEWASGPGNPVRVGVGTYTGSRQWQFLEYVGTQSLQAGDFVYFRNKKDYDGTKGAWSGENAIYLGTNSKGERLFAGFGLHGVETEETILKDLDKAYTRQTWAEAGRSEHDIKAEEDRIDKEEFGVVRQDIPGIDLTVSYRLDSAALSRYLNGSNGGNQ